MAGRSISHCPIASTSMREKSSPSELGRVRESAMSRWPGYAGTRAHHGWLLRAVIVRRCGTMNFLPPAGQPNDECIESDLGGCPCKRVAYAAVRAGRVRDDR